MIITVNAQRIKVNFNGEIHPYNFKIEKIEVKNGKTMVYATVKQKKNFSYNLLFDDCQLIPNSTNTPVHGTLCEWNESNKALDFAKSVNDEKQDKFILIFSGTDIIGASGFNIKMGTIQNRKKTPVIFENIAIKK
ncbi:MAG: hypothetical protein NC212_10380 [Staphylococcus sp.]|nr:hypothetical protein [Staphylococcus sp.]